jgi:hypothetical protein
MAIWLNAGDSWDPRLIFRKAKSKAGERRHTLKDCVTEATRDELAGKHSETPPEPVWMDGFGKLRRLAQETRSIQERIDQEFEVIEPEDRL